MFEKAIIVFLTLLTVTFITIHLQRQPQKQRVLLALLVILSFFSVFFFTDYGKLNWINRPAGSSQARVLFHWHEMYHYYLGSKYYPELKNSGLYEAVAQADSESAQPMITAPRMRDLSHPLESITLEQAKWRVETYYKPLFTEARWQEFKADLETMKAMANSDWLNLGLFDAGFNPPPTWNVIGTPLANLLPLSLFLPYLDLTMLIIACCFIFRSFGLVPLCLFITAFCTNFLSDYHWIMGSFLRYGWFLALVIGTCMLKERKFLWAGLAFGFAASVLIFPILFLVGSMLGHLAAWKLKKRSLKPAISFTIGAGGMALLLILASLLMFGLSFWQVFFERITNHSDMFFVWHIGFKKIATWGSDVANQNFWWAEGLIRFKHWNEMLIHRWHDALPYQLPLMAVLLMLGVWCSLRLPPEESTLLIGGLLLFLLLIPANYYYAYLALVPVVLFRPSSDWRDHALIAGFFALMVANYTLGFFSNDDLVKNYVANIFVFSFFIWWIGLRLCHRDSRLSHYLRHSLEK